MLIIALLLSALFLWVANAGVSRPDRYGRSDNGIVIGLIGGGGLVGIGFAPVILLQAVMLVATIFVWRRVSQRKGVLLLMTLAVTVLVYAGYSLYFQLHEVPYFQQLREEFPFESMDDRLLPVRPEPELPTHSDGVFPSEQERLRGGWSVRNQMLIDLHERHERLFINSPGFGQIRMIQLRPTREYLVGYRSNESIPQPEPPKLSLPSINDQTPEAITLVEERDTELHRDGLFDFINTRNLGYFKDRQHVAGFQSHRFSEPPRVREPWQLRRIELVGLLLHKEPVVYISDNLPRMDELRGAPTRSLDAFETTALASMRQGKELLFAETAAGPRMLGSIRSVEQCVKCHETKHGALLGAFSYTLKRRVK